MSLAALEPLAASLGSIVALGGPVVAILLGVSVISLTVIIVKLYQFWRGHVGREARAREAVALWNASRPHKAEELASAGRSVAARAVAMAIGL